jgi:hypothetical protein
MDRCTGKRMTTRFNHIGHPVSVVLSNFRPLSRKCNFSFRIILYIASPINPCYNTTPSHSLSPSPPLSTNLVNPMVGSWVTLEFFWCIFKRNYYRYLQSCSPAICRFSLLRNSYLIVSVGIPQCIVYNCVMDLTLEGLKMTQVESKHVAHYM